HQLVRGAGYQLHPADTRQRPLPTRPEDLADWLRRGPEPLGVLACDDAQALRVLGAAQIAGLDVPGELAVVGVGNDRVLCTLADPPLTSIDLNTEQIGYEAAALLDRLLQRRRLPRRPLRAELPPRGLVVRRSSDVLALADPEVTAAVRFIHENAC